MLLSVTNRSGQSTDMIASCDRSRPAFSTSRRSSANDFGRSGFSRPSAASRPPHSRSSTNDPNRYRMSCSEFAMADASRMFDTLGCCSVPRDRRSHVVLPSTEVPNSPGKRLRHMIWLTPREITRVQAQSVHGRRATRYTRAPAKCRCRGLLAQSHASTRRLRASPPLCKVARCGRSPLRRRQVARRGQPNRRRRPSDTIAK